MSDRSPATLQAAARITSSLSASQLADRRQDGAGGIAIASGDLIGTPDRMQPGR